MRTYYKSTNPYCKVNRFPSPDVNHQQRWSAPDRAKPNYQTPSIILNPLADPPQNSVTVSTCWSPAFQILTHPVNPIK
jgi:hypothetical protein